MFFLSIAVHINVQGVCTFKVCDKSTPKFFKNIFIETKIKLIIIK